MLPQLGRVLAFDLVDAVGRVRLDDGTELRFGQSAIPGTVPVVGTRVRVHAAVPHPLGGLKATSIERVTGTPDEEREIAERREDELRIGREQQRIHDAPLVALAQENAKRAAVEHAQRRAEAEEAARLWREEAAAAIGDRQELDAWRAALGHVGLARHTSALLAAARPVARLVARDEPSTSTRGATKLGGDPDLPAGFVWPMHAGEPLDFLVQIALSEVPLAVRTSLGLPARGLLAFFYAARTQPWGIDVADRGSVRIAHFADVAALARTPRPAALTKDGVGSEEIAMTFVEDVVLPPVSGDPPTMRFLDGEEEDEDEAPAQPTTPALDALGLSPAALTKYARAFAAYESVHDDFAHVVGGYARPIQGAMEPQCAAIDGRSSASEWRLLLQLDSGGDVGQWGDDGRLYFWVRESDLAAQDFDRAWCILQSH